MPVRRAREHVPSSRAEGTNGPVGSACRRQTAGNRSLLSRGRWVMTPSPAGGRIVVGVDGSAASDAAVRWAVREARLRRATVHLVSAHHSDPGQRARYAPSSWMMPEEEQGAAAEALVAAAMELARRYLPPGHLSAELANEPPARALPDRAAGAELRVLGTTRPGGRPRPWGRWRAPACGWRPAWSWSSLPMTGRPGTWRPRLAGRRRQAAGRSGSAARHRPRACPIAARCRRWTRRHA